ncbi:hypothetical protein N7456_008709 [Penicillium angulare]|uniref:Uncharacterized protein n=1 Tax=Penicillium angulare TaxID=116970 RepID=A0A9W9K4I7_9EURO|nr:hypothetical protein N7456_008709 [Penicillium angulare]
MEQQTPVKGNSDFPMRDAGQTSVGAMLHSALPDYLTNNNVPEERHEPPAKYLIHYFFYGTLTAPETLKRIIDLTEEPKFER